MQDHSRLVPVPWNLNGPRFKYTNSLKMVLASKVGPKLLTHIAMLCSHDEHLDQDLRQRKAPGSNRKNSMRRLGKPNDIGRNVA